MNTKHLIAAIGLALVGSAALASEASQFEFPASHLSRAEVAAMQAAGSTETIMLMSDNDATQFTIMNGARSRDEVRAEARAAARDTTRNPLTLG